MNNKSNGGLEVLQIVCRIPVANEQDNDRYKREAAHDELVYIQYHSDRRRVQAQEFEHEPAKTINNHIDEEKIPGF